MKFDPSARLIFTSLAVFVLLVIGSSGCRQNETNSNTQKSSNITVTASRAGGGATTKNNPATLAAAPPALLSTQLKTVDGSTLRLGDYAGKVVIVDVWATWCPPCRQEIPHLVALGNEYKDRGVEVVGLTTEDPEADAAKVKDFAQKFGINYQLGWATPDLAIGVMRMSRSDAIPQTLIITRDGRIIKHYVGFDPVNTPISMRNVIEQAIKM